MRASGLDEDPARAWSFAATSDRRWTAGCGLGTAAEFAPVVGLFLGKAARLTATGLVVPALMSLAVASGPGGRPPLRTSGRRACRPASRRSPPSGAG